MLVREKMDTGVFAMVEIGSFLPKDHFLRKIDAAVDFSRLYDMVAPLYCEDNGRPDIALRRRRYLRCSHGFWTKRQRPHIFLPRLYL